ncbi:relaxase/mobilization nuclease domain-containing protein [Dysgonomonas sp. HDW5A]|uniref:relaxase/mobilization nuclease domain-containing protein n=1 Tax=Dysgonomonas sp. HDW5A TaxID=2714926 RepID=UPI0014087A98|nr:relaxase/mobilization nuclease domain-containing protein [Dysgonomonas sp. HDW5A]QIK58339.1 relaxase/mobilization nuclease domain-containing protein [Dysgonomonas sp. HDW5A]
MIGKIVKGKSFKGCISYVLDKDNVRLIDSEGVLTTNTKAIINSFYLQSLMNPKLKKSVGHIPISYSKEDESRLTDQFMIQLAKEYMEAMKIKNTQYIIVRHNNTDNPHCHIVFNRVDNDGKTISDKNDHYRNEKVCKQLKDKYNLTYGESKEQTNIQKLKGAEKTKYEIYHAIKATLKISKDWQQFEQNLKQQGISIAYKYKGQTDEVQGISFRKGEHTFKGSDIDRQFSYSKLNNLFQQNHNQKQHISQKQAQTEDTPVQPITESMSDNLGGIFNIHLNGEDHEEDAFRKRMEHEEKQRRKKSGIKR